jgi:hypothetical protein
LNSFNFQPWHDSKGRLGNPEMADTWTASCAGSDIDLQANLAQMQCYHFPEKLMCKKSHPAPVFLRDRSRSWSDKFDRAPPVEDGQAFHQR